MKPLPHIFLLTLLACASTLIAQDEAENADPAAIYPELPALANLVAAQIAEADSFPEIKDPGDPVHLAQLAPLRVVADLPAPGDPIKLAEASPPPAVPAPSAAGNPVWVHGGLENPSSGQPLRAPVQKFFDEYPNLKICGGP